MKLRAKLLISHLLIALLSIILVALLARTITANKLEYAFLFALNTEEGPTRLQFMTDTVESSFKDQALDTITESLLIGGALVGALAVAISLFVSARIVRPVQAVADASQHIANGHYNRRVEVNSTDELGQLADNFNQMAASLADTETLRQQLIADVSHELKTPLAGINAYLEAFQDGIIVPTNEQFYLVQREVVRLQCLVDDLQELSLVAEGAVPIKRTRCNPIDIVNTVTARLLPQFDAKRVALVVNTSPVTPSIQADRERIEQVLINLLGNGLQYTPAGGQVTVSVVQHNGTVQFGVQDTGIGISPADLDRVFQRFFRVDKSRARSSGGSGIGLTIARYLIEAHQGLIWADSPGENQGATFYFTLPIS